MHVNQMLINFSEVSLIRPPSLVPRWFLEQETLPLLLSTGWFQERIRAWFHNQT